MHMHCILANMFGERKIQMDRIYFFAMQEDTPDTRNDCVFALYAWHYCKTKAIADANETIQMK